MAMKGNLLDVASEYFEMDVKEGGWSKFSPTEKLEMAEMLRDQESAIIDDMDDLQKRASL